MAYRADIEIAVRGAQELKRLQDQVSATSKLVDGLNNYLSNIGGGGVVRSINNLNETVAQTAAAFNKAALGTDEATLAARNFVSANTNLTQGLAERLALLKSITEQERRQRLGAAGIRETSGTTQLGPGPASPVGSLVGQKSPVAERINQTLQARKDEIQLQAALLRLEEKSAATLNEKLELQQRLNRAALAQGKLDVETVSAQQAQRQQFLAGKSGTAIQGPLAGPGAMGFPVALSLSKVEQQALEVTAKKQEILQRMVTTRQTLVGLADNLRRIDQNAANQIKVVIADAERLNAVKLKELQITQQIRASEGAASNAARQRLAQEAARRDRIQNAGFGNQGPALPPQRAGRSGGGRLGGAISGSIIGGSFPLLFGQGAGAAAGGAVGGLVGGLAGPGGSFAGSLLGTLLGDIASQGSKVKDLAADIGFSADQTERLKNAFALAGQEADKFEAATQNIRGLGLSIDDQADAITLAANLTEAYGGKIDKIAAAYANFVEKGKVGIADINKFTSEGIPILDQLEKKYNTNRDGILKLAKDGEISAQALSDALIAIGNSSDTAVKKTVSGWDKAWSDIKAGGSLFTQAVSAYFNALVGSAGSSTSSIAESFGSMFKAIVQNSIDATAALARNLANLARFAANISATAQLGGLNIGATVSKNIAKNIETTARNFDAALQKITLPEPGKIGAIAVPGQAPASGGSGAKGPQPPEDRTAQLREEFAAIVAIGQAENKIRDALFEGLEVLAAKFELDKQIADIERDRNKALMNANYESERVVITKIAEARIVDAQLKQQDKISEINQKRFQEELQVQEAVRSSVQSFTDMRKEQELQLQYSKTYSRLLMEGMLPAEAERIANFEKTVAAQLKAVDLQLLITSAAITEAQARGASTFQLEKDLDLLERKRKAIEGEAAQGPGAGPTDRERLQTEADRVRGELNTLTDPINAITTAAAGIGDAFGTSFKGIISGSMTAKEALASFFTSVADMFLDMAAQIIAKMITMAILNTVLGVLPGASGAGGGFGAGGAGFGGSNAFGSFDAGGGLAFGGGLNLMARANGGPVSSGQTYMVGERGPELFVPGRSGTIVPNDKMGGGGVNVVVNVDAKGSSVEGNDQGANQLGRVISAAVQSELIKQQRPGGILAR